MLSEVIVPSLQILLPAGYSAGANPGLFSGGGAPLKNDVNDMRRKQILKPDNEEDLRLFTKNTQQT